MTFQPYRSPSTGYEVRAVLFDTFGTVMDWRTGVARQAAAFAATQGQDLDAEAFADDWRALYQPAMEAIRKGVFKPARLKGRPVRQLVQQRISFKVGQ